MRDRLIELIGDKPFTDEYHNYNSLEWAEHFADYLLAEGVIVLPCKVGQTVYRIARLYNGEIMIAEGIVFEFAITHESSQNDKYRFYFLAKADTNYTSRQYSKWCEFADFGKTVFLTREEAEKALAERSENGK